VIAGPSGHGKTTTLAALVDLINSTKAYHIITIDRQRDIVEERVGIFVDRLHRQLTQVAGRREPAGQAAVLPFRR